MDYTNYEELHKLIKKELSDKYVIASANIIYLEELEQRNYVVFITQFRDVLTHISNIYLAEDILTSKDFVLEQLERAKGHLERIVIDSYMKIGELLLKKIKRKARGKASVSLEVQIAQKIKSLRLAEKDIAFEEKCSGYQELIEMMENIIDNKI